MTGDQVSANVVVEPGQPMVVDLSEVSIDGPSGVVWGMSSSQLNANLVSLQPGEQMNEHVNDEVDVLVVVESGAGRISIDDAEHGLNPNSVVLVPRGASRSMQAGEVALLYFSIHVRREGLLLNR